MKEIDLTPHIPALESLIASMSAAPPDPYSQLALATQARSLAESLTASAPSATLSGNEPWAGQVDEHGFLFVSDSSLIRGSFDLGSLAALTIDAGDLLWEIHFPSPLETRIKITDMSRVLSEFALTAAGARNLRDWEGQMDEVARQWDQGGSPSEPGDDGATPPAAGDSGSSLAGGLLAGAAAAGLGAAAVLAARKLSEKKSDPPADPVEWHYTLLGQQFGPFTRAALIEELRKVGFDTLVWKPGFPNWITAREAGLEPPPPPPPPKCAHCGAKVNPGAIFCGECGKPV